MKPSSFISDIQMYARFAMGLRGFFKHKLTLAEARQIVEKRLAERENNFINLVAKGIFGNPNSPYLQLLRQADCELGDIRNTIKTRGLENTLLELKNAGVYLSFDEFKCRTPLVRNGKVIACKPQDFDNPYLSHYYQAESGGTTGAGTRVSIDLEFLADQTPLIMIASEAYGVLMSPTILWRGILPSQIGILNNLFGARFGNVPKRWFSPVMSKDLRPSLKNRLATSYFIRIGRLWGVPIPRPEPVSLNQAGIIAHAISEVLQRHGSCLIRCLISMALRVCVVAEEEGIDLTGATFMGSGEPPTPAKVGAITRCGARHFPTYFFAEAGAVGLGCAKPADCNDLHFMKDSLALIQTPQKVPGAKIEVPAFCFTTLLPSAPKLLLNVESDDYGIIEKRHCGCELETAGLTEHLRHVRSFRKLTGEGVTLIGSEMVRILEEVLPSRFGGSPLDYQLAEEEDANGFTKLSLLINPKVGAIDDDAVIAVVLEELGRGSDAADLARAIWDQAKAFQVIRKEPVWTNRGKLMPLHLSKKSS
jgi:hypothetical protein